VSIKVDLTDCTDLCTVLRRYPNTLPKRLQFLIPRCMQMSREQLEPKNQMGEAGVEDDDPEVTEQKTQMR